ncbi:HAMP domain-containing sensor histidine kinase [Tunturiibacter gelidiferens]|uniref:histidine kinase n=1 Tax=Tunturiibacter gelidiferens TaxID=3069689 RepID=A0AAU7Z0M9_9BACT
MNATYRSNSAGTCCLSEMPILRARKVNAEPPKPPIPVPLVSEVPLVGGISTAPQICNGCKESKILAVAGRIAQSVSHDLRNHLTAIYSNVEFMSESRTTDVEREELREEVRAVIQDMTGMLDSLLLLAKTGQPPYPRLGSLNEVVEHAACMVRAHPDARDVDVVIQNVAPVACWMDSTKLGSAVYNLLLNACQAARLGLAPRRVEVTLAEDHRLVHIRVVDSGRGVPASIRKTLFQPFVSTDKINGIGLGLSIVDRTAREHGGYADLEESGQGRTVFGLHISKYALENLTPRSQP